MKYLIIDGNSILNRAFYAAPPLTDASGNPTGAVFGFINIMLRYMKSINPDAAAVAFDLRAPTFRHRIYGEYKAGRRGMPDELASQLPVIKNVLSEMNIEHIEKEGFEADDILGALANKIKSNADECYILTGDRDSFQLIDESVYVVLPSTKKGVSTTEIYTKDVIHEKYGIEPIDFIQMKGLMGDSSDNIPGIRGIGEKTALTLVKNFKSLENIYENIDSEIIKKGVRAKLLEDKETAFLSRELGTILTDFDIDFDLTKMTIRENKCDNLRALFEKLGFRSLISRMNLNAETYCLSAGSKDANNSDVLDFDGINDTDNSVREQAEDKKAVIDGLDIEIASYNLDTELPDKIYLYFSTGILYISDGNNLYKLTENISDFLFRVFENEKVEKYAFNIKEIYHLFDFTVCNVKNVKFDFLIAAYLINPAQKDFSFINTASQFLSIDSSQITKEKEPYLLKICADLYDIMHERLCCDELDKLYYEIELPLTKVLADMEKTGVKVDKQALSEFGDMLNIEIEKCAEKIYELAGEEFNILSPKQLGVILFEKMGLKAGKKTKTGYSTSAEVLEKLAEDEEIARLILEYRKFSKLKSTYVDGLIGVLDENGLIHTKFQQHITLTGRLSSAEPNLQNIPVRTKLGREMRKMFITRKNGNILIDADYSQIELRILSHIADDAQMLEIFRNGQDLHAQTAAKIFNIDEKNVTDEMRSRAKAVNFGIVYGIGTYSLSKDIHVSMQEAKLYIENYFRTFSGVRQYMSDVTGKAYEDGFVKTIMGRRRYLPELSSSSKLVKAFGERVALNAPIQGSAADIIKLAMVRVYEKLREQVPTAKLILQIHDELIIECSEKDKNTVREILKHEMEHAVDLNVKLTADIHEGKTWYDAK